MANIKRIGEAHPDLGVAGAVAAHLAEPLRSQHHAVVLDLKLDVGTDRLDIDLLERVPGLALGLTRRGRRGQLVNEADQRRRAQRMRIELKRMHETQQRLPTFGKYGIGEIRVFQVTEREDKAADPNLYRWEDREKL